MLTETEKKALVEELSDRLGNIHPLTIINPHILTMVAEEAVMPIIERVIAERDLDALLDSVHPVAAIGWMFKTDDTDPERKWFSDVRYPYTEDIPYDCQTYMAQNGYGPTRTAAVQAAVKAAKEAQCG